MRADMCNCLEDSHTQAALRELVIGEEVLVMSILMWSEARLSMARVVQYIDEYRDAYVRLRDICPSQVESFPAVESMELGGGRS